MNYSIEQCYTPDTQVEGIANQILNDFNKADGAINRIRLTPADEIAEKTLGLTVEYDSGLTTALGYLDCQNSSICLNPILDPARVHDSHYLFQSVIAHEIGHFLLHTNRQQPSPSNARLDELTRERQANYFADCLLMPKAFVEKHWNDHAPHWFECLNSPRRIYPPEYPHEAWIDPPRFETLENPVTGISAILGVPKEAVYRRLCALQIIKAEDLNRIRPVLWMATMFLRI
jgi:Zn-dependent peptidase ImmA (M78 family)